MSEHKREQFKLYTCVCGKNFIPTYGWVYKIKRDNSTATKFYCSYSCWRKAGGGNGKNRYTKKAR